jgi:transcriptional regulator with PAS, ATPase and Fis domain
MGMVADTDCTVVVTGESGTGKEIVARTLHDRSRRANRPFVAINCGAIPGTLLESELFGYERGAFTGAASAKAGKVEAAHGGTLFFDEIGELDPALQVKLLRMLQSREFERVGGIRTIKVDARIIVATNRDLKKACAEGRFRDDLYYRINVFPIVLPPLRDRVGDLALLAEHFIALYTEKFGRPMKRVREDAMEAMMRYDWPGNVRELENLMERMVILGESPVITPDDLPDYIMGCSVRRSGPLPAIRLPEEGVDLNAVLDDLERSLILQAIRESGNVKNRAAGLLRLKRTTLLGKMKKLRIDPGYEAQADEAVHARMSDNGRTVISLTHAKDH